MRKAYPINTDVLIMGTIEARIMAVTFYGFHEKYLLMRMDEGKITEDWYSEDYFTVGKIKKIGFEV